MKYHLWHIIVYKTARLCVIPFVRYVLSYRYEKCAPKSSIALIFCNHTTLWDHLLIGVACPRQMYFVAGEHLFRKRWLRMLTNFMVKPIIRRKGVPATGKLVKESGACDLPDSRWLSPQSPMGSSERKGPMYGEMVDEDTKEQLAVMSVDEINEAIRRDLYVNAFHDQNI